MKAENVLYCQSELATGFIKDGQNWRLANYEQKRFTLKFNQDFTILKGVLPDGRVMKCSDPITIMPEVVSCIEEMFPWKPFLYYKDPNDLLSLTCLLEIYFTKGDTDSMYSGKCENF